MLYIYSLFYILFNIIIIYSMGYKLYEKLCGKFIFKYENISLYLMLICLNNQ